ncbi:MAG: glycosyl hydrolase family 8 [Chloroflexota bacterium]
MRRRAFLAASAALLAGAALPVLTGCSSSASVAPTPAPSPAAQGSGAPTPTPALPPEEMLRRSWSSYRVHFIQSDGRTMDPMREMATTSEGQSYSLLKAVWQNDRATFDRVLDWTNANLRVRGDALFAFLWGRGADGTWGVLDSNIASDADQDIALALIFAYHRWGGEIYLNQARAVLRDLWQQSVVTVGGRPYMAAGNWALDQENPTLNPSYLAPYAYRIFAEVDPERAWPMLVDTSYDVLFAASGQPLGQGQPVGLPPNWCAIRRDDGAIVAPLPELDTNFGYDAFRTYWRVALDWMWFGEERAARYLYQSDFLRKVWQKEGSISAVYSHDGRPVELHESAPIYAGLMANLLVAEPELAPRMYAEKLAPRFTERDGQVYWDDPRAYYTQNWLWFGVALYAGALPNLAA